MKGSIWRKAPDNVLHYGKINTGKWWASAEAQMEWQLTYHSVPNKQKHFLYPIIFFIDGTHCNHNRRLQAKPVLCSIGNINLKTHKDPLARFFLGLLPMNILSPAKRKVTKKRTGLRSAQQKLYHDCLHIILQEIIDLQSNDKENGTEVAVTVT
eukprot:5231335-Ditylum_brightwellii.AAC.1